MDREAVARAARRRQAEEVLESERDRAEQLQEEIDRLIASLEGPRIDEAAFAGMSPGEVELVRPLIAEPDVPEPDLEAWVIDDEEGFPGMPDPQEEAEEEIARLEEEVAESRLTQAALEAYLRALG